MHSLYDSGGPRSGKLMVVTECLVSLVTFTLVGFVIYALHTTDNGTVFEACGNSLWNYMLARLIMMSISSIVLACIVLALEVSEDTHGLTMCLLFLVFAYCVTIIGIGASITNEAMKNTNCTSTLSDASFTHSPLLAELGYVFVSIDSTMLFFLLVASLAGCGVLR